MAKDPEAGIASDTSGLLIIVLLNPMFNHYGVTMLYYIESSVTGSLWRRLSMNCTWCSHVYRDTVVFLLQYSDDK